MIALISKLMKWAVYLFIIIFPLYLAWPIMKPQIARFLRWYIRFWRKK